ncbi:MAG: hypothetical protein EA361_02920 [Bacteroidetes bacterium]|nr:MAG: hypothetical protein EA361_02920 [Bacteroidota bacterium]
MKNTKNFRFLLLFSLSVLIIACGKDDNAPEKFDYSEKIIGKWQQAKSYDLVDGSVNPTAWDWFDVENGFTLELSKDSTFVYTNYGSCITGTYSFNANLLKLDFYFDCDIEFRGESINHLTEFLDEDKTQNIRLLLVHADAGYTEKQSYSMLERIDL